jgi:type IX secretion system PorP/SprF family membrane protein
MKNIRLIIAASILGTISVHAQDIHFSQITESTLLLNPSQAGLGHDVRAVVNFKDQWRSVVSAPYQTINASADFALIQKLSGSHLGIGVNVFNDKAGDSKMSTTIGQLHVAGAIGLNSSNVLSAGVVAGYGQRNLNYGGLTWGNQYDGQQYNSGLSSGEPVNFASYNYMDIGAGLSWMFRVGNSTMTSKDAKIINIGFAVHHLNKPVYSFYNDNAARLPMKYVAHGNAYFGIKNTNMVLEPSYYFAMQGGHMEITPGMLCKIVLGQSSMYTDRKKASAISLGGYFRFKDAIVPMVRYEYMNFSVATSYDINVSGLSSATRARGGFEVSIRFMTPGPFSGKSSGKSLI